MNKAIIESDDDGVLYCTKQLFQPIMVCVYRGPLEQMTLKSELKTSYKKTKLRNVFCDMANIIFLHQCVHKGYYDA